MDKKYHNYLVYCTVIPFLLPIIESFIFRKSVFNFYYYIIYTISIFIYLVFFRKHATSLTKFAVTFFFTIVLISYSYTSISAYLSFYVPARDPGIFFSMIQAFLMNRPGFSSVTGNYHFATHQNYILLLITPLYLIIKSPLIVQLLGSTSIWLSGIVLWKITRLYFNQFIAFFSVLSFYLTPVNYFYAFRPELFYPLAIFTLYYVCVTKRSILIIILSCLFLLSIKEDAALYLPGFIFLLLKDFKKAFVIVVLAILIVMINIEIIQPYFVLKNNLKTASTLMFYKEWGHNNREILINIVTSPGIILKLIFGSNSGFWHTYGSWLFLPLLSPFIILSCILPLILFACSNNFHMYILNEYYPIALSALCFIGVIQFGYYLQYKKRFNPILRILPFIFLIHPILHTIGVNNHSLIANKYGRWQEFYPIEINDIKNFNLLKNDLLLNYKFKNICPSNQIYPHLDLSEFPHLQAFGWENINQKNCINVFSTAGDIWPTSPSSFKFQMEYMQKHQKCKSFGTFYYCDNLSN